VIYSLHLLPRFISFFFSLLFHFVSFRPLSSSVWVIAELSRALLSVYYSLCLPLCRVQFGVCQRHLNCKKKFVLFACSLRLFSSFLFVVFLSFDLFVFDLLNSVPMFFLFLFLYRIAFSVQFASTAIATDFNVNYRFIVWKRKKKLPTARDRNITDSHFFCRSLENTRIESRKPRSTKKVASIDTPTHSK